MTLHTGTRARRCDARRSRERGEWTKFLDIENPHNTATVDAALLDDGASVELKVTAPDRPGLLADLTQAIVRADLTIDQARVTTPGAAKNTFQARGSHLFPPLPGCRVDVRFCAAPCAPVSAAQRAAADGLAAD